MPPPPPGGASVPGDDWQLPGDRWLPAGYRVPPGRPGWQVDPVGWQHVSAPPADPLVARNGFGDWFDKVFGVIRRSWQSLIVLQLALLPVTIGAAVAVLPLATRRTVRSVRANGTIAVDGGRLAVQFGAIGVVLLVSWIVATIGRGAGAWIVTHDAAGEPARWSDALRFGLRRFWPFVGWSVLAGLTTAVGALACLVPGIYVGVVFNATLTGVVAFERGDVWSRCFALARGAWWALLGRLLVIALIGGAYGIAVNAVTGAMWSGSGTPARVGAVVVGAVLRLPVGILGAAAAIVTYAERRAATGGCTTADLLADLRG
jgi:hypothetical protein